MRIQILTAPVASVGRFAALVAVVLAALTLPTACGSDEAPAMTSDAPAHSMAKVIAQLGDEEVLHSRAGLPYSVTQAGDRTHDFGEELYGLTTEPGFVAGWAMLVRFQEEEEPDCRGKGLGFARCVKKHLDAGETCTVSREDDGNYVAFCEVR